MGSSSSKAARSAARRYPTQVSSVTTSKSSPNKITPNPERLGTAHHEEAPSEIDNYTLATGAFSRRLQQMGVAQPNPTFSPSSIAANGLEFNPERPTPPSSGSPFASARSNATISALEARQQLQDLADQDLEAMGHGNHQGRRFIDTRTLVEAFQLRSIGVPQSEIESRLKLRTCLLNKLGRANVVRHVSVDNTSV